MKVGELIAELQKLDPDLYAVVSGYEGGFHHAAPGKPFDLVLNISRHVGVWYCGPHDKPHDFDEDEMKLPTVRAVCVL